MFILIKLSICFRMSSNKIMNSHCCTHYLHLSFNFELGHVLQDSKSIFPHFKSPFYCAS
ncbi:uncharacterized protein DS421_6g192340 [Arachis hypogaea]|nr:uncharacterized protein DS421_6g192340 [Arachis hypogaea]